ncbi:hypothetical protein LPB140_09985 [Sphingorhabdus lutea]|uniref:VOC domain-containing protein n=1 Tax=Sphingorhabdus lutea TaxID=1913578 RepID=A0A1L3JD92_9SPHN|nr:VOC family protein [Sphingorhabdus lutea]APG63059.1 hypothetical protein LPB140_09985 [Sphingorhabdus lutea]
MPKIALNYIEIQSNDVARAKLFYQQLLGLKFTEYGPEYIAAEDGPAHFAIAAAHEVKTPPLPVFETDDIGASYALAQSSGQKIVAEIFGYPGGQRFEMLDVDGNRIAIYQPNS